MILFHGTNTDIETIDLSRSLNHKDFGKGFYLTALEEQARKYSQRFLFRGDKAFLNHYILNDDLSEYNVKKFEAYNEEWLDFLTSSLKKHAFYNLLINNILYLCVT